MQANEMSYESAKELHWWTVFYRSVQCTKHCAWFKLTLHAQDPAACPWECQAEMHTEE